jgi:hypothetical protein
MNAQEARDITSGQQIEELYSILDDITQAAKRGDDVLHIPKTLSRQTIRDLKEKEFQVIEHDGITIQKEGIKYSIKW